MPVMSPVAMPTKDKGFFGAIWMWLVTSRRWKMEQDWIYSIGGIDYKIPKGFVFDGASVPKYFRSWLSPMGVLLIAGLIHDYGYKYAGILRADSVQTLISRNQKQMDIMFRDIAIADNGFRLINYIAYYALRLGGWYAWKGHRKHDK
jgi:hypothetical protein